MSSSRDAILSAIRQHDLQQTELPSLEHAWMQFADPVEQFVTVLASVGGQCVRVPKLSDINAKLESLPQFVSAFVRCSTVPEVGRPNVDLAAVTDPHHLENVDFAILRGELAVAENGAVWITDEPLKHRVLYFITQHLALVVPTRRLVHTMHAAYQQLTVGQRQFGAFISGPSKTADIEQSLVIGAHGPRSHVVFLVDEE